METKDEYVIRIGIDSDKCDAIWSNPIPNGTKQLARAMIQDSNFTTIQKLVRRKQ